MTGRSQTDAVNSKHKRSHGTLQQRGGAIKTCSSLGTKEDFLPSVTVEKGRRVQNKVLRGTERGSPPLAVQQKRFNPPSINISNCDSLMKLSAGLGQTNRFTYM
jgi:hypothetical protein